MAELVVFGAGDIARLADHYFRTDSEHEVVAFTVDDAFVESDSLLDRPMVPFSQVSSAFPPSRHQMFVALSYGQMNRLRAERCAHAKQRGYSLASYVLSLIHI